MMGFERPFFYLLFRILWSVTKIVKVIVFHSGDDCLVQVSCFCNNERQFYAQNLVVNLSLQRHRGFRRPEISNVPMSTQTRKCWRHSGLMPSDKSFKLRMIHANQSLTNN